ncbi:MAG: prenyltransferase [Clostridia bacterium]|nr:prenyltransferase [Clostridia bacterium]
MIARFFDFVEIKTKITSFFAFVMTIAYLFYLEQPIDWKLTGLFFIGMFLFDMATTAINNYIDTKTNTQVLSFRRQTAKMIIFILMSFSMAAGILLVFYTDMIVLLIGGLCFVAGVFYTYGPVPISRQPLGEILSGVFYGLFIPFLVLYINMPRGTYFNLDISKDVIGLQIFIWPLVTLLLLSINPICATANIMLANNICDLEKDIKVKRHTLPYYLGERAVDLFVWIYYAAYASTILMVILSILPPLCLLVLLTLWPVHKNNMQFRKTQNKETTFFVSIKNYLIIMSSITFVIFVSGLVS